MMPYGRVERLSVSTDSTTFSLKSSLRITPSPPLYFPAPPEPERRENCSNTTGYLGTGAGGDNMVGRNGDENVWNLKKICWGILCTLTF